MEQDLRLRAAARAIYDACYPGEEWTPVAFDQAELFGTIHYRQAVVAAREARTILDEVAAHVPRPLGARAALG